MNNAVFGKTMENVRKHRVIKLATTDKRRNQLASEPNYHTKKHFSENSIAMDIKKTNIKMNKPVYLCMSILDISITLINEFSYDYIKPKYKDKAKLCYMDTDRLIIHIKTEDFMKTLLVMLKNGLTHQTTVKLIRPLSIGENKTRTCFFKDELEGKIMKEFFGLRAKIYAYLMDDDSEKEIAKGTEKNVIKRDLMCKNYKDSLFLITTKT